MTMEGWVKLHRKIDEWEWADSPSTCYLFLRLMMMANHKDRSWRGQDIKRGQLITSLASLSKRTGLTVRQCRTALKNLISTNEITNKSTNRYRMITITNYDTYQKKEDEDDKQVNKQDAKLATSKRQANDNKQEYKEYKEGIYTSTSTTKTDSPSLLGSKPKARRARKPLCSYPKYVWTDADKQSLIEYCEGNEWFYKSVMKEFHREHTSGGYVGTRKKDWRKYAKNWIKNKATDFGRKEWEIPSPPIDREALDARLSEVSDNLLKESIIR